MKNRRSMQVLILLLTLLFLSTTGKAYSEMTHSKNFQSRAWHNHYYQIEMAIGHIKKEIVKLQGASYRSDKKNYRLNDKLAILEAEIVSLQKRLETIRTQYSSLDSDVPDTNETRLIIPAGYFYQSINEFDQYDFSGAYLKRAYFRESVLTQTNFSGANLKMSSFYNASLNGVIFSGADLSGADFDGAVMTNITWGDQENGYAVCPDGENAANYNGSCEGHLSK